MMVVITLFAKVETMPFVENDKIGRAYVVDRWVTDHLHEAIHDAYSREERRVGQIETKVLEVRIEDD